MEKNTTALMEKLFRSALESRMNDTLSSLIKNVEGLIGNLHVHEKKDAMKVILSLGKDAAINFFDQKLVDLDRGPAEDGDGV